MPLYVYRCPACGETVEVQRKIAEMDEPIGCFACVDELDSQTNEPIRMKLVPTAPSGTFPGAATWRGGP